EREPLLRRGISRPVGYMCIRRVPTLREIGINMPVEIIAVSSVDGSAVLRSPLSDGLQDFYRLLRYRTVRLGTNVQQVVAAAACAGDQIVHNSLRSFPVVVSLVVSPTVIERHAGFPCAPFVRCTNFLLGC